jgi:hypothetical protein
MALAAAPATLGALALVGARVDPASGVDPGGEARVVAVRVAAMQAAADLAAADLAAADLAAADLDRAAAAGAEAISAEAANRGLQRRPARPRRTPGPRQRRLAAQLGRTICAAVPGRAFWPLEVQRVASGAPRAAWWRAAFSRGLPLAIRRPVVNDPAPARDDDRSPGRERATRWRAWRRRSA